MKVLGVANSDIFAGGFLYLIVLLVIAGVALKGYALWKSAKADQNRWFIVLFIVNSLGILPAIYLKFFQKKRRGKK